MKQSATDAHNSVSGDQVPPGPSNSTGGAVSICGNPGAFTDMLPAGPPAALTLY
jgi:hypothetical protein